MFQGLYLYEERNELVETSIYSFKLHRYIYLWLGFIKDNIYFLCMLYDRHLLGHENWVSMI